MNDKIINLVSYVISGWSWLETAWKITVFIIILSFVVYYTFALFGALNRKKR